MTVSVRFFASLGEELGIRDTQVDIDAGFRILEVWNQVTQNRQPPENLLCALNQAYADFSDAVSDGDEVAFFPPVNGG